MLIITKTIKTNDDIILTKGSIIINYNDVPGFNYYHFTAQDCYSNVPLNLSPWVYLAVPKNCAAILKGPDLEIGKLLYKV